jgi:hypothetical protein
MGSADGNIPELLAISIDFDVMLGAYDGNVVIEIPEQYEDVSDEIVGVFDNLFADLMAGLGSGVDGEGNSNVGDADELVVGNAVQGMIEANGDPKRYQFEAGAGDVVQIAVRADEGSNLDTYLQLFEEDGERLADNDDAFSPPSVLNLGALDSYIEYEIEEDGIYFVEVSSVFAGVAGSYTLTLAVE